MKQKTAIIIINQGTPKELSLPAIKSYLREFLSDRHVIKANPIFWKIILEGLILPLRPKKIIKAYEKILISKNNMLPLRYYTSMQKELLNNVFPHKVEYAMRYGYPSIYSKLQSLQKKKFTKVIIFPLYPQYSKTTTLSTKLQVIKLLKKMNWRPKLMFIPSFFKNKYYIKTITDQIKIHLASLEWQPQKILLSFHSLPKSYIKSDPYLNQCLFSAKLIAKEIDIPTMTTFQSRFGPIEWLKPYTDKVLHNMPKKGIKNIVVVTPGFISDCLETLEEIDIRARKIFMNNGGKNFSTVPCINDSPHCISLLKKLISTVN